MLVGEVQRENPAVHNYVLNAGLDNYFKAYTDHARFDIVSNQANESWNKVTLPFESSLGSTWCTCRRWSRKSLVFSQIDYKKLLLLARLIHDLLHLFQRRLSRSLPPLKNPTGTKLCKSTPTLSGCICLDQQLLGKWTCPTPMGVHLW